MLGRPCCSPATPLARSRSRRGSARGDGRGAYRASQEGLGRDGALNVIAGEQDAQLRAMFEREARLAAAAEHPNVLPVYEAGEIDGRRARGLRDAIDKSLSMRRLPSS